MPNIYLKLLLRQTDILKTSIYWAQKIYHQVNAWGAPTHADIIEF